MRLTRLERAAIVYGDARREIRHIRELNKVIPLSPYLKIQAVTVARFLVRKGREFQYTNNRVTLRRDLRGW